MVSKTAAAGAPCSSAGSGQDVPTAVTAAGTTTGARSRTPPPGTSQLTKDGNGKPAEAAAAPAATAEGIGGGMPTSPTTAAAAAADAAAATGLTAGRPKHAPPDAFGEPLHSWSEGRGRKFVAQDAAQGAGFASDIMDYVVKVVTGSGTATGEAVSELPDSWHVDGCGQVVRMGSQGQGQQGQQEKAGGDLAKTGSPCVGKAAAGSADTAAEDANATAGSGGDKAAPAEAMKLYAAISLDGGPVVPVRAKIKVYQYDVGPWHMCTLYDLRKALTAARAANTREGVVICPEELPTHVHEPGGKDGAEALTQLEQVTRGSQQQQPQQQQREQQTPQQQQGSLAQVVWLHTCRLYQPKQQPGVCVLVMDVTTAAMGVTKAAAAARGGPALPLPGLTVRTLLTGCAAEAVAAATDPLATPPAKPFRHGRRPKGLPYYKTEPTHNPPAAFGKPMLKHSLTRRGITIRYDDFGFLYGVPKVVAEELFDLGLGNADASGKAWRFAKCGELELRQGASFVPAPAAGTVGAAGAAGGPVARPRAGAAGGSVEVRLLAAACVDCGDVLPIDAKMKVGPENKVLLPNLIGWLGPAGPPSSVLIHAWTLYRPQPSLVVLVLDLISGSRAAAAEAEGRVEKDGSWMASRREHAGAAKPMSGGRMEASKAAVPAAGVKAAPGGKGLAGGKSEAQLGQGGDGGKAGGAKGASGSEAAAVATGAATKANSTPAIAGAAATDPSAAAGTGTPSRQAQPTAAGAAKTALPLGNQGAERKHPRNGNSGRPPQPPQKRQQEQGSPTQPGGQKERRQERHQAQQDGRAKTQERAGKTPAQPQVQGTQQQQEEESSGAGSAAQAASVVVGATAQAAADVPEMVEQGRGVAAMGEDDDAEVLPTAKRQRVCGRRRAVALEESDDEGLVEGAGEGAKAELATEGQGAEVAIAQAVEAGPQDAQAEDANKAEMVVEPAVQEAAEAAVEVAATAVDEAQGAKGVEAALAAAHGEQAAEEQAGEDDKGRPVPGAAEQAPAEEEAQVGSSDQPNGVLHAAAASSEHQGEGARAPSSKGTAVPSPTPFFEQRVASVEHGPGLGQKPPGPAAADITTEGTAAGSGDPLSGGQPEGVQAAASPQEAVAGAEPEAVRLDVPVEGQGVAERGSDPMNCDAGGAGAGHDDSASGSGAGGPGDMACGPQQQEQQQADEQGQQEVHGQQEVAADAGSCGGQAAESEVAGSSPLGPRDAAQLGAPGAALPEVQEQLHGLGQGQREEPTRAPEQEHKQELQPANEQQPHDVQDQACLSGDQPQPQPPQQEPEQQERKEEQEEEQVQRQEQGQEQGQEEGLASHNAQWADMEVDAGPGHGDGGGEPSQVEHAAPPAATMQAAGIGATAAAEAEAQRSEGQAAAGTAQVRRRGKRSREGKAGFDTMPPSAAAAAAAAAAVAAAEATAEANSGEDVEHEDAGRKRQRGKDPEEAADSSVAAANEPPSLSAPAVGASSAAAEALAADAATDETACESTRRPAGDAAAAACNAEPSPFAAEAAQVTMADATAHSAAACSPTPTMPFAESSPPASYAASPDSAAHASDSSSEPTSCLQLLLPAPHLPLAPPLAVPRPMAAAAALPAGYSFVSEAPSDPRLRNTPSPPPAASPFFHTQQRALGCVSSQQHQHLTPAPVGLAPGQQLLVLPTQPGHHHYPTHVAQQPHQQHQEPNQQQIVVSSAAVNPALLATVASTVSRRQAELEAAVSALLATHQAELLSEVTAGLSTWQCQACAQVAEDVAALRDEIEQLSEAKAEAEAERDRAERERAEAVEEARKAAEARAQAEGEREEAERSRVEAVGKAEREAEARERVEWERDRLEKEQAQAVEAAARREVQARERAEDQARREAEARERAEREVEAARKEARERGEEGAALRCELERVQEALRRAEEALARERRAAAERNAALEERVKGLAAFLLGGQEAAVGGAEQ